MLYRTAPVFRSLGAFLCDLEARGEIARIVEPVSTVHEITEIHRRVIAADGPALLFENVRMADGQLSPMPIVVNLFGSPRRIARGLGIGENAFGALGELLCALRQPEPVRGLADALGKWPLLKTALAMRHEVVGQPPVQQVIRRGGMINLDALPVQTCWPGEPAPLITWPLVVTRPPDSEDVDRYNLGVYRMQVLGRDRAIMRWLAHRGGAAHHRQWQARHLPMPVAVVIGADPATILAAVTPLPETLSEYRFAGLLSGERPRLARCATVPLLIPAEAEIVLEGYVSVDETAPEGPYGDHTGYYNAVEPFPVMHLTAITHRRQPVYLSTFTGRAPDEPAVLSRTLNDVFLPLVRQQFPEVKDCWLPPEACSYRIAVVSIRKSYPGQARRVMMGLWSMLPQFSYTKLIIVVDEDIDARNWSDVMWAVATRSDPGRDLMQIENTPIDYLDFASPVSGLGGKLGIDATNKLGNETQRAWGAVMTMDPEVCARIDAVWPQLGLGSTCRQAT